MSTYTFAIETSDDGENWMPEADRIGTEDFAGTAGDYARIVLDSYLADVAADAELPPGTPGSEPCSPTRIVVWRGLQQDTLDMAAAVIYTGLPAS